MIWRQELKYIISGADRVLLLSRLSAALRTDPYAMADGTYRVRTLYFDDPFDSALSDTFSGAPERSKYRLRMYNGDPGFLRLEEKRKRYGRGIKPSAVLTKQEASLLISGSHSFLANRPEPFLQAVYAAGRSGGLQPRLIADYTRASFCCADENVRVTIDSDIRSSSRTDAFFDTADVGVPIFDRGQCVLEIKYNDALPAFLPALLGLQDRPRAAMSKFAAGEIYY